MINNSKFTVMVHAEILDDDLTSKGVSSVQLEPTTDKNEYTNVNFDFNIDHLPLGDYYFVLKPVDISNVDNYVTYNKSKGIDGLRKLTPRECLRLMGFKDDFKIAVSNTAAYMEAGNSIVVDVLIALLKEMDITKYGVNDGK